MSTRFDTRVDTNGVPKYSPACTSSPWRFRRRCSIGLSPFAYSEGPSRRELGQRAVARYNELLKYHETHSAVWLEQGEREKAEEFATETRAIINDFMDFVNLGGLREPGGPSWEEFGEDKSRSKTWIEIHRRTRNELRRLREGLGAEFHRGLS